MTKIRLVTEGTIPGLVGRGAANGVAPLGADSKVPDANLPTYGRITGVQAVATANAALVPMKHNPVDATAGNRTMTLADATSAGQLVVVSKKDATANTVAISVAHLRDGGAGSITLVGQYEAITFTSKADGTWWPIGDHKTKAYFDATYPQRANNLSDLPSAATARTNLGLGVGAVAGAASATAQGIVELATNTETTTGTDTTRAVTPAGLQAFKDALVNAAPGTLDQLNELAAALGNDPNFATTITGLIAAKLSASQKGAASGVAPLGADSKVPDTNLPQRLQDADLSATYGAALVATASSGTTDQSAAIQAALGFTHNLTLRGSAAGDTFRVDSTILLETDTLCIAPATHLLRVAAASSMDPVVWVNKNGGTLYGYGLLGSTIKTEKRAPLGVVCVGGLGITDPTGRAASYNVVRDLEIGGMTAGGQTTGNPDYALYLCNNEIGGLTSYFNRFSGLRLRDANVGICLQGYANGNQFSDVHLYQCGNEKALGGAGIKLTTGTGSQAPIENNFQGVFHHGSSNATTLFLDGITNYNSFTGIVPEQGGASAQVLHNTNDTTFGCIIQTTANVNAGDTLTTNFKAQNTYTRGGDHYGTSTTVATSTATTSTVTGARTHGTYVEDTVTITGLTEFAKVNFLKVTVPASAGAYLVEVDVAMGSTATNAAPLQTATGGKYLLQCTTGAVTVIELSTHASIADTYILPLVSGRDVTFAAQYGTNGGATTTGALRAKYRVPTTVTVTQLSSTSTASAVGHRAHFPLRSTNSSTANRLAAGRGPGDRTWDTTLVKPVYWTGSAWVEGAIRTSVSGVLDFPSIAAAGQQELTFTLAGAAGSDPVTLGPPASLPAGLQATGYVSATNTVTIRLSNVTAAAIDPPAGTWTAAIYK